MGNLDLVFIINRGAGYVVKGSQYVTQNEALQQAIKQFENEARASIEMWHAAKERDPESVNPDYRPEDELEITSIECYTLHV
jgi:hypothetical protein